MGNGIWDKAYYSIPTTGRSKKFKLQIQTLEMDNDFIGFEPRA
jgi:hypothetical protein